jgi:cold shock CspA family protein
MAISLDPKAQADFIVKAICELDDDAAVKVITDSLTLRPEVAPVVVQNACPDLAFAPASSMTGRRSAGIVGEAASHGGLGRIDNPELKLIFGSEVTATRDQLGDIEVGTAVNFAVLLSDDFKPQAFDIQRGHDGASKPASVNASHLAAAQLLQGGGQKRKVEAGANGWIDHSVNDAWKINSGWQDYSDGKGTQGNPDVQQVLGQFPGVIKSFSMRDGFGFIECGSLAEKGIQNDVYLHQTQLGACVVGDKVLFTAYLNRKGQPQAMNVSKADAGNNMGGNMQQGKGYDQGKGWDQAGKGWDQGNSWDQNKGWDQGKGGWDQGKGGFNQGMGGFDNGNQGKGAFDQGKGSFPGFDQGKGGW